MRTSVTLCAKGTSGVTLVLCRGFSAVPNVLDILGVSPKVLGLLASIVASASASVLFAGGGESRALKYSLMAQPLVRRAPPGLRVLGSFTLEVLKSSQLFVNSL